MYYAILIGMVLGSKGLYYISMTGTVTVVDCVVSIGLILGQCVVSIELVLRQWWTVSYQ